MFSVFGIVATSSVNVVSCGSSYKTTLYDVSTLTQEKMNEYLSNISIDEILPKLDFYFDEISWLNTLTTSIMLQIHADEQDGEHIDQKHFALRLINEINTDFWVPPTLELYGSSDMVVGTFQFKLTPPSIQTIADDGTLDLTYLDNYDILSYAGLDNLGMRYNGDNISSSSDVREDVFQIIYKYYGIDINVDKLDDYIKLKNYYNSSGVGSITYNLTNTDVVAPDKLLRIIYQLI